MDQTKSAGEIPELMTSGAVAEFLGVTTRTLATYKAKGMLPFMQVGRVVRYRKSDVKAFVEAFMVQPQNNVSWEK